MSPLQNLVRKVVAKCLSTTGYTTQSQVLDWGDITEKDYVILVVGRAGAGKTTFINTVAKSDLLKAGRGLAECTRKMETVLCEKVKPRIVLIDTPPHPDEDSEKELQDWLQSKVRKSKLKVKGVVYVHQLGSTTNRVLPQDTLKNIQRWGGPEVKSVPYVMVKTHWNDTPSVANQDKRLNEEWTAAKFSGPGPVILKQKDDADAAWGVVKLLLEASGYNLEEDEVVVLH